MFSLQFIFYPALTGSKIPTSKFSGSKKLGGGSTVRKSPTGEG
ncbi:spermidine/putrescine ABC transporter ATP-binding protein [Bacillus anthracis]|nr:spermidine/putrescine ABC transporter ATP-binding protein [Bacillus thuringiensis LM1212]PFC91012.1 spermidine/putrescine ABC transporter ATP-binding protein [Bacillus anthracis]PFT27543.1 spermidine/putrescine ABC transporter ATP-binding protein [Bacillus thuringiensis]PFD93005.1 spermidine/putrescine ABC transporter ATP-binding protein [Bacillus anthracis]PFE22398.1 spermidine/putrescine ABC transporter ATP-binding protein [Bacillus anthracis]